MSFEPKYSDEQRQAVFELRTLEGLTGREIADRCKAGTHGLTPFTITRDSANRIARKEAERRRKAAGGVADPAAAVKDQVRRLLALSDAQIGRLERRNGKIDGAELRELAKAVQEIERVRRTLGEGGKTPAQQPTDAPTTGGILEAIASQERRENGRERREAREETRRAGGKAGGSVEQSESQSPAAEQSRAPSRAAERANGASPPPIHGSQSQD